MSRDLRTSQRASFGTMGFTRRQMLRVMGLASAAGSVALGSEAYAQSSPPSAPQNVRIGSGEPTPAPTALNARAVLTAGDLRFVGFIRFPSSVGNLWYTHPSLAMRTVAGNRRAFIFGNIPTDNSPVYEFDLPDAPPQQSLESAPTAILRKNWGEIQAGRTLTGGDSRAMGGLYWDASRNALWWSYGAGYVPTSHHPTIGATILNDQSGTFQSYGPWRTQWTSQRTRGAFASLPSAFASAYTAGNSVGVMSHQASGNATSPFGAILSAIKLPDPTSTPPDTVGSTHFTCANQGIILHDLDHPQSRDARYKVCGWNVRYDCSKGTYITPGTQVFGGPEPSAGENDTMNACVWVDLPDKHGLLYFGQLVTTPAGYRASGDPDGLVHMGYGDLGATAKPGSCCHGQDDPFWQATGPFAHYRVPMGWIYNPTDLIASAQGQAALWSRTPATSFQWKSLVPQLADRYASFVWGAGAVFDAPTRRIYALLAHHDTVTSPPWSRPVLMVFEVT